MKILHLLLVTVILSQVAVSREILFYFFEPESTSPTEVLLVGKKKAVPVQLSKRRLSPPLKLPSGDLQLSLVASQSEVKDIPDGAPKISIPKEMSRAIVIVTVDNSNTTLPIKPVVIDASNKVFPLGSTKMMNFSDYDIVAKFGTKEVSLKSKKQTSFDNPREGEGAYPTYIDYVEEGEKKPIFRGRWFHHENYRKILFVIKDGQRSRPKVFSVVDRNLKVTEDKGKESNFE